MERRRLDRGRRRLSVAPVIAADGVGWLDPVMLTGAQGCDELDASALIDSDASPRPRVQADWCSLVRFHLPKPPAEQLHATASARSSRHPGRQAVHGGTHRDPLRWSGHLDPWS